MTETATVDRSGQRPVVHLTGSVDLYTSSHVRQVLTETMTKKPAAPAHPVPENVAREDAMPGIVAREDAVPGNTVQGSATPENTDIVVNAAGVTIIDSAGLGVLVTVARRARAAGGELRLASCPPAMRELLGITALDQVFRLYDTVEDALAATSTASA
ncbi:MAG: STAS domain-containing protein [Angustibacter sp.]